MTQSLSDELAALMCSKVCHDLVSPIGALGNGVEVLEDEDDQEMRETALDLIAKSAKTAAAKLQFARLAFGLAGGVGGVLDLAEAARAASDYFSTTKAELDWNPGPEAKPKDEVRLLLNLLMVGLMAIPRGGKIVAEYNDEPFSASVRVSGQGAQFNDQIRSAIDGRTAVEDLDARMIQPFFAGVIARRLGAQVELGVDGDEVTIKASASI